MGICYSPSWTRTRVLAERGIDAMTPTWIDEGEASSSSKGARRVSIITSSRSVRRG